MEMDSTSRNDLIKFQKLKMKYFQNEDIKLEYVLNSQVRQFPKDWIGLYPRGWNNLQQYVTFEWAIWRPCDEKSPYRTEIFKHKFHSKAITFDKQYQFVYVNKNMKVLGCSTYFGFLPPIPFSGVVKSDISMLHSQRNGLKRAPNVFKLLKPTIPPLKLSDVNQVPIKPNRGPVVMNDVPQKPLQELQQSSQNNCNSSCQTAESLLNADMLNSEQELVPNTPCELNSEEESDSSCESESVNKKVKSTAEGILCLQNKIKELEVSLEKSRVSQKIFRIASQRSKREKMAYQNFVSDLLDALSKKKVVRIIDGQGTEMLVKCVPNSEFEEEQISTHQSNSLKETPKERRLKAVIGFQEQTIQQLQHRLACVLKEAETSKENKSNEENRPASSESEPLFTAVHKNIDSNIAGNIETFLDDNSRQANEAGNNLNDIIVSNIDESESQTCIHSAEAAEPIQETFPTSIDSEKGECCEELQSSPHMVPEYTTENVSADTKTMFKADAVSVSSGTKKGKIVSFAKSPSSVEIYGEKVSFSIVK